MYFLGDHKFVYFQEYSRLYKDLRIKKNQSASESDDVLTSSSTYDDSLPRPPRNSSHMIGWKAYDPHGFSDIEKLFGSFNLKARRRSDLGLKVFNWPLQGLP